MLAKTAFKKLTGSPLVDRALLKGTHISRLPYWPTMSLFRACAARCVPQRRFQATDAARRGAAARQRRSAQLFWPSVRSDDAVFAFQRCRPVAAWVVASLCVIFKMLARYIRDPSYAS